MVCFLVSVQLKLIDFLKGSPLLETVVVSPAKTLTEPSVTRWLQTPQPIAEGRGHSPSSCQGESLPHPHSSPGGSNSGGLEPCQFQGVGKRLCPSEGKGMLVSEYTKVCLSGHWFYLLPPPIPAGHTRSSPRASSQNPNNILPHKPISCVSLIRRPVD